MSWFNPWDGLKTKMCRYLLQRYLGQFFENNLNLEQLKVDLYNGKAVVEDIFLKVDAFNDLFEDQGWAFEVVSGHIGCLTVVVPWNALMTNDSSLEISNLTITLRPVTRHQSGTTMLESMWSSVSSSMQMAEECMKQVDDDVPFLNHNNALIGLEKFAETIDNVLNRIRAKLTNTTLNIEYLLPRSDRKLVLSVQASHVEYKNKTGYEMMSMSMSTSQNTDTETDAHEDDDPNGGFNALPMIAKHNLVIEGLSLHTSEVLDVFLPPTPYEQLCKIVELKGAQNIQINIKQTENIVGPKVSLELSLDDIYFMLTPRQIHLLIELSKGFNSGGQQERPKKGRSLKSAPPPSEYQQQQQPTRMTGILGQNADWSTGLTEPEPSEYSGGFVPRSSVYARSRKMSESTNSMLTSCTNTLQQELGYTEKSGEILKFKVQVSKLYGVALHNDILVQNTANIDSCSTVFDQASYLRYSDTASVFFRGAALLENHLPLKQQHYLLLRAAPIIVSGSQQRYFQELTSRTTLSATAVDLCEILDQAREHLLLFDRQRNCPDGYHIRPEIVITQSSSFMFKQNHNRCTNKIECILDECTAELDISLYDRLGALFGCSPFARHEVPPPPTDAYAEPDPSGSQTELSVKCENLRLQLRFPVVDGRAANDPQKIPWWQKNVRQDFLALEFRSLVISFRSQISIASDELDAYYCDADKQSAVHLLRCRQQTNKKIQIDVLQLRESVVSDDGGRAKKPLRKSPFSSKCTFGYTSHVEGLDSSFDKTDSLLPGDTEEINEFCDSCTQSSKLKIFAFIPLVKVVLESKGMYELIYNRLNGDLFMWEPRSPHYESYPGEGESRESSKHHLEVAEPQLEEFRRNQLLSTSAMESSIYFSMAETTPAPAPPPPLAKVSNEAFSFELFVEEGSLILFSHLLDPETNQRAKECGKFQVNVKELRLFTVNGLDNDANRSFFCIQLGEIEALHCGNTQQDLVLAWSDAPDKNLLPTIHNFPKSQQAAAAAAGDSSRRLEVLSVVAEIKKQPEQRIKRMKMSFGITGAILQHHSCHSEHSWLTQLMDFMDVADFPIEEYEPFALVSELQLHVWNAGIDYRPRFFPQRAFLDLGYCTLSSNIISSMSGCTLRLLAEDCVLQLGWAKAPQDALIPVLNLGLLNISFRLNEEGKGQPRVDLRSSIHDMHLKTCYDSASALAQLIAYVANDRDLTPPPPEEPVLNEDAAAHTEPKSFEDQEVSDQTQNHVNKLMADAVMDVECTPNPRATKSPGGREEGIEIFYFPDEPKEKRKSTPAKPQSKSLMVESPSVIGDILDFESNVILQSYYEQSQVQQQQPHSALGLGAEVQLELGSLGGHGSLMEERDFDIIHDEEISRMDKFGVKQIYVSEEPLQIVDNHFCLPHEKVDLLRPPANFPVAESSYTLCEMTFTWHLYGGRDFPDESPKKSASIATASSGFGMSDTYKFGVSQAQDQEKPERKGSKRGLLPKEPKGSKRNLEVLVEMQLSKIRFSYESYPLTSIYSSRQVLLVSEIEIRDRLRSSDINKFLYHPAGNNLSHKPDENMVIVKALNVRPNPQKSSAEECSLRVSILPIKLNIDQDTLLFLEDFFSGMFRNSSSSSSTSSSKAAGSAASNPTDMPVMSVSKLPDDLSDELPAESEVKEMVERNLNVLIEENSVDTELEEDPATAPPVFFREVIFSPALPICFDYHGRRIELSRGPVTGLIMGLAQLQGSGICLREIVNRRGILGWHKLCEFLAKEWLKDIKRNQLPNILSGIGPTNAVLQLFQGVYDLFRLPIEQYNKDGRIIRGFQLGAQSFTARTALAALEITSRIIHLLQFTAETTFDMLSAGPSLKKRKGGRHGVGKRRRQGRPKDLREGVANAYTIVREGINESANTLIEAAITEHDQKGYSGAVGAVVRQIPQLVVCPAVLATQATTNILGGAKSSLVPEAKLEARDKWKQEIH